MLFNATGDFTRTSGSLKHLNIGYLWAEKRSRNYFCHKVVIVLILKFFSLGIKKFQNSNGTTSTNDKIRPGL